jgi:hypothetical protein
MRQKRDDGSLKFWGYPGILKLVNVQLIFLPPIQHIAISLNKKRAHIRKEAQDEAMGQTGPEGA